ncbi:MAG TPA: glycosyltransferase family 4 protein [Alphaproteobacteria bacterium]
MRIAQVAPLYESCPPQLYGGTERVVSYLTEELVRQGHDVTLFASGDSRTAAKLVAPCARALRLDSGCKDPLAHHIVLLHRVMQQADRFDIIHFHTDYLHFPLAAPIAGKTLTTLHGRLDIPDLEAIYREFPAMPLVSISDAQRIHLPWVNWQTTVHHGLPADLYALGDGGGGYLAFLGRISPEKRPDRAIEIARRTGLRLKIAAKVDKADTEYFHARIRPLLDDPLVEFVGEIGEAEKSAFLGKARALLFPVDWPEPFGLVMIEAMACGTPVIAWPHGSVPEIIEDGVTGFLVDSVDAAAAAIARLDALSRATVRRHFERRFSVERMARDYIRVYAQLLETGGRAIQAANTGGEPLAKHAA